MINCCAKSNTKSVQVMKVVAIIIVADFCQSQSLNVSLHCFCVKISN